MACTTCIRTEMFLRTTPLPKTQPARPSCSERMVVRANRFVGNRGHRAYGLIFQSSDRSRLEKMKSPKTPSVSHLISAIKTKLSGNRVTRNYIGLRSARSETAIESPKIFSSANLHPIETGASDVLEPLGRKRCGQLLGYGGPSSNWTAMESSTCRIASSIFSDIAP